MRLYTRFVLCTLHVLHRSHVHGKTHSHAQAPLLGGSGQGQVRTRMCT